MQPSLGRGGETWWRQEPEAAGHIVLTARKQRGGQKWNGLMKPKDHLSVAHFLQKVLDISFCRDDSALMCTSLRLWLVALPSPCTWFLPWMDQISSLSWGEASTLSPRALELVCLCFIESHCLSVHHSSPFELHPLGLNAVCNTWYSLVGHTLNIYSE